jgi:hypothetical protein
MHKASMRQRALQLWQQNPPKTKMDAEAYGVQEKSIKMAGVRHSRSVGNVSSLSFFMCFVDASV